MAKVYNIPLTNGVYTGADLIVSGDDSDIFNHQMDIEIVGAGASPAGSITIAAVARNSSYPQAIPDGEISLASPSSLVFQFKVSDYQFTIAGASGTGYARVTDDSFGV